MVSWSLIHVYDPRAKLSQAHSVPDGLLGFSLSRLKQRVRRRLVFQINGSGSEECGNAKDLGRKKTKTCVVIRANEDQKKEGTPIISTLIKFLVDGSMIWEPSQFLATFSSSNTMRPTPTPNPLLPVIGLLSKCPEANSILGTTFCRISNRVLPG